MNMIQLICLQVMLLIMINLNSCENRMIVEELREIKVEISK